jgi:hypothetical protein
MLEIPGMAEALAALDGRSQAARHPQAASGPIVPCLCPDRTIPAAILPGICKVPVEETIMKKYVIERAQALLHD